MEENVLSIGQQAIVNGYLANFEPAEAYDPETCLLYDTDIIASEMDGMADFDHNALADHLATLGYRVAFIHRDCVSGWILKKKNNNDQEND